MTGDSVNYRKQNCMGWCGLAKVSGKEGQCVLIRHGGVFDRMHPSHLMKVKKEFGSPRNQENKISSNEINEVLEEGDEGQCNKGFNSKSKELKDPIYQPLRSGRIWHKVNS